MAKRKPKTDAVEIIEGDDQLLAETPATTGEGPDGRLSALQARIAELEAQVARQQADAPGPVEEWPKALYRRHPIDAKHPMGYEARRFADPEALKTHGKGWVDADSPAGQALLAGE